MADDERPGELPRPIGFEEDLTLRRAASKDRPAQYYTIEVDMGGFRDAAAWDPADPSIEPDLSNIRTSDLMAIHDAIKRALAQRAAPTS